MLDVGSGDGWINANMRIKSLFSSAVAALLVLAAGCVGTETGKPVGGVPFTKDTITSRYEKPLPTLVKATREVLKNNGKLLVDNVANNTFQAKVNQHNVWVKIAQADPDGRITAVYVQARGPMGGDIDLAAEISKQIALQLTVQQ